MTWMDKWHRWVGFQPKAKTGSKTMGRRRAWWSRRHWSTATFDCCFKSLRKWRKRRRKKKKRTEHAARYESTAVSRRRRRRVGGCDAYSRDSLRLQLFRDILQKTSCLLPTAMLLFKFQRFISVWSHFVNFISRFVNQIQLCCKPIASWWMQHLTNVGFGRLKCCKWKFPGGQLMNDLHSIEVHLAEMYISTWYLMWCWLNSF